MTMKMSDLVAQYIMKMLDECAVAYQIILTKIDKISAQELQKIYDKTLSELKNHPAGLNDILATSAEKKLGLEVLKAEIFSLM